MKLKTSKREYDEMIEIARRVKEKNTSSYMNQIENINLHLKELFRQIKILSLNKVGCSVYFCNF